MFDRLFYREKGLFLQSMHSVAALAYIAVLFVLTLVFSHPFYLVGLLLVTALAIWAADGLEAWESYLKVSLGMIILIIIINPIIVHAGKTVLWHGPRIPVIGRLTITLEAICYGAAMSVRLLAVISVFCLYNLIVHPDKTLQVFSRFAHKSTLIISLATRMFPAMVRDLNSIRDVQRMRGVDFASGNLKEKIKKYSSLLNILLLSSLEGSLQTAEAMQARAFGSGPRSCYRRELFRPRDLLCLSGCGLALTSGLYGLFRGFGRYQYYPQLGYLIDGSMNMLVLAVVLMGLLVPVALSWGWKHCRYLKSKI
ncbi:MAG: energy-coupling factor transporter transmembrane protein EcfT [Peptococcaceae bacterium]|nr:MAG: energy-coupling factor transporter transmembrane protein EcfT [Peptococcaceae bacterium]